MQRPTTITVPLEILPDILDKLKIPRPTDTQDPSNPLVVELQFSRRFEYAVDWDRGMVFVMDHRFPKKTPVPPCIAEVQIDKKTRMCWPNPGDASFMGARTGEALERAREAVVEYLEKEISNGNR